jgi:zinc transport system ATP-binding protein
MTIKDLNFIHLENVSYQYGARSVLENVTLSLKRGGFYLFVGPNGGGKTTLLKLIMGLLTPTRGTITINGKPPKEHPASIGYVPQTFFFDPLFPLSVEEFVRMGELSKLTWYGTWPPGVKEKTLEMLDFMGILKEKDRSIGAISGGQRQRASLARALMSDPEIIILDEPTTGLDAEVSKLIQEKILEHSKKKTILFVTHTIPDILSEIDQAICVKGKIEILKKEAICNHHSLGVYHIGGEEKK